ncbi:hypothetical protein ABE583_02965 [Stenotrophomonas sp. TWI143]|uniref:hypothetical protein n=1 Tax=Stenotrophomonas sp. TWI143 TaxID=3136771 RepID=UPI003209FD96
MDWKTRWKHRHWDIPQPIYSGGRFVRQPRIPFLRRTWMVVRAAGRRLAKLQWLWVALAGAAAGKLVEIAVEKLL